MFRAVSCSGFELWFLGFRVQGLGFRAPSMEAHLKAMFDGSEVCESTLISSSCRIVPKTLVSNNLQFHKPQIPMGVVIRNHMSSSLK